MVKFNDRQITCICKEGTTLMEAAESIGIHIHIIYWKGLNEIPLPVISA